MTALLANHLGRPLEPGTNLKGGPAPPTWLFLLPQPALRTVLTAGAVPEDLEPRLEGLVDRVERVPTGGVARPTGDVDAIVVGPGAPAGALQHLVDSVPDAAVVLLPGAPAVGRSVDLRVLTPGGVPAVGAVLPERSPAWALPAPESGGGRLGRVTWRALRRVGLAGGDRGPTTGAALVPSHGAAPDGATTVVLPASARGHGPPAYVRELAGLDPLDGWALTLARGYATQKLVFVSTGAHDVVVKVARTARGAVGLGTEADVLAHLAAHHALPDGLAPRVLGRRRWGPALVVAESRLPGHDLRDLVTATPTDPLLGAVLDQLHTLGVATVDRTPRPVHESLDDLVAGLAAVYGASPIVEQLRQDAREVSRVGLPCVVLHGDPGPQNVLVDAGARVGLIDWENGEPVGPPLWDALYLLLTSAELGLERRGRRPTAARVARTLLGRGGWYDLLLREADRASTDLGFSVELAAPLTRLFLAYLARRDVGRLDPATVRGGRRYGVLAAAVDRSG